MIELYLNDWSTTFSLTIFSFFPTTKKLLIDYCDLSTYPTVFTRENLNNREEHSARTLVFYLEYKRRSISLKISIIEPEVSTKTTINVRWLSHFVV